MSTLKMGKGTLVQHDSQYYPDTVVVSLLPPRPKHAIGMLAPRPLGWILCFLHPARIAPAS